MFAAVGLLFTGVWLELAATVVFALPALFAVELFVVFDELAQAEKSNANEAMLRIEEIVTFKIFVLSFLKADLSISVCASEEAGQIVCLFRTWLFLLLRQTALRVTRAAQLLVPSMRWALNRSGPP